METLHPIEGHSNYLITRSGKVYSRISKRFLDGAVNPAGYKLFRIQDDSKVTKTWGLHRLLAYVFLKGSFKPGLVVNHKDGVKSNNEIDNLEWVTYRENLEHANEMGLSDMSVRISTRCYKTGLVVKYLSINECSEAVGITADAIRWRLRVGECVLFPEKIQFRKGHGNEPWKTVSETKTNLNTSKEVLVYSLVTHNTFQFPSLITASKFLKVSPASVSKWVNDSEQPVIPGKYLVKWANSTLPWRDVEDVYLDLEKTTGEKAVRVECGTSGEVQVFTSITNCAKFLGVAKSSVFYWLSKKSFELHKGYYIKYYSSRSA